MWPPVTTIPMCLKCRLARGRYSPIQNCFLLWVLQLLVEKPAWKLGSKSSISLKSSLRSKQSSGNVDSSVASAWKVMADDDDLDLIDDDDLLTEEDLKIVESGGTLWLYHCPQ